MSIIPVVFLVAGAVVVVALAGTGYSRYQYDPVGLLPAAPRLISASLTIVIAAFLIPSAWRDVGRFGALFMLLIPVLCSLTAVSTDIIRRGQAVITTVVSAVMVLWSLLHGLSPVFLYIIPAFVMIAAAATSWFQRQSATAPAAEAKRSAT